MVSDPSSSSSVELENEEPLSVVFQRALVMQRAGSMEEALEQYNLFCKAAQQCQVNPAQYAEVHVNMGAIYLRLASGKHNSHKLDQAKHHFQTALHHRPKMGTAHVNLAVLHLQLATSQTTTTPNAAMEYLRIAENHCETVVACKDDPRSVEMATKLLGDIQKMLRQVGAK